MDVNSKINWSPGMEITAKTLIGLEEKLDFQRRVAIRAALGNTRMGMVPGSILSCNGSFFKNTFEIEHLQCKALLPSGRVVDADEQAIVPIPMLFGDRYYLTIGVGDGLVEFEKEGVAYTRPIYEYGLKTQEEVETEDVMPMMRFSVKDGVFSIDTDYIAPCLSLNSEPRFEVYIDRYVIQMSLITSHENLENGDGKRALLHYLFILKSFGLKNSVHDFLKMLQEIAQAIDYYIITPNMEQPVEILEPSQIDVQLWLNWFGNYLIGAVSVLDKVVLEDKTIDYDALLRQAKAELYAQLHEELIVKLLAETKEELLKMVKEELENSLDMQTQKLTDYINNTMKPDLLMQIQTELKHSLNLLEDELSEKIYERLYEQLFEHLFNALYIPEPESEKFIPLI